jgi:hypothetical protein
MKYPQNTFLATKDIEHITGKSQRTAQRIMAAIKKQYNKQKHQPITYEELCLYFGIPLVPQDNLT